MEADQPFQTNGWKFNGIDYWPMIRVSLCTTLYDGLISGKRTSLYVMHKKPFAFLYRSFEKVKNSVRKRRGLFKAKSSHDAQGTLETIFWGPEILFLGNKTTTMSLGGIYYQHHLDHFIVKHLKEGSKVSLVIRDVDSSSPMIQKNWFKQVIAFKTVQDAAHYSSLALKRPNLKKNKNFLDFREELISRFQMVPLNDIARFEEEIHSINAWVELLEPYFRKTSLKKIYIVSYYNMMGFALSYLGRKYGVLVQDVQHGLQGKFHHAYTFSSSRRPYNILPQHFICWSQQDQNHIESWGRGLECTAENLGGNGWDKHASILKKENLNGLAHVWDEEDKRIKNFIRENVHGEQKILLYTLQHEVNFEEIGGRIREFVSKKYYVFVRVHPGDRNNKKYLDQLHRVTAGLEKSCNIMLASLAPLPLLLNHIALHVTAYSSTTLECAAKNIPTYFVNDSGKLYLQNLMPEELVLSEV
jgi:hypothetical protein